MQPEHLDLHTSYGHHYTTLNLPVLDPPGQALPNTEIFRRIAPAPPSGWTIPGYATATRSWSGNCSTGPGSATRS